MGGVQKREAFILVTYFYELNITVYTMLSAKNVFMLAYLETEHDIIHKLMFIKQ